MRTRETAVAGDTLIRTLAGISLTASAVAGAALAMALAMPAPARAGTLTIEPGARAFALAATPTPRFGPSVATAEDGANLLNRLAAGAPTPTARAATPQFRLDADDGAVTSIFHTSAYDLRLEFGTVFYHAAAVPGQHTPLETAHGRMMSRLVTRF